MLYQMEDDCRLCRRCVTDLYQRWVSIPRRNSLVSHEMVSGGTAGGVWGKRRRAEPGATLHVIEQEETAEMTEWEKAQAGYLYDANYDQEIVEARTRCADLCYEFNSCKPSDIESQRALLGRIFGKMGKDPVITAPFYCDYGFNISVGDNFYTNHNCTILDGAKVELGDNVFIAPNCVLSTAGHALDSEQRSRGLEIALPIKVGNNVWIGANVTVLPGVTIGDNTVIGAGSVVTKDIPAGVIAVGNPCRVMRKITDEDKKKYRLK